MKIKKSCGNCKWALDCFYDDYSAVNGNQDNFCSNWDPAFDYFCKMIDNLPADLKNEAINNPYSDAYKILKGYYRYD